MIWAFYPRWVIAPRWAIAPRRADLQSYRWRCCRPYPMMSSNPGSRQPALHDVNQQAQEQPETVARSRKGELGRIGIGRRAFAPDCRRSIGTLASGDKHPLPSSPSYMPVRGEGASSSCRGRRAAWSHGVASPGRFDLRVPSTNLLSHSPSQRHHQNSQLISAATTAAPQGAGRWAPGGSGARRLICRRWKNRSSFSPIAWDAGGHGQGLRRATAETAFVVTRPASGDA